MELLEFELGEVLGPDFEGDLIVEDALDSGNQGSAEAEDDHPEELTQGQAGVEQVHDGGRGAGVSAAPCPATDPPAG
jgi:hypothetical protein